MRTYVSLECTWTLNRKKGGYHVSRPVKEGEDFIATQIAEIKEEHPKARNIVVTEDPLNDGLPYSVDILIDYIMSRRPDLDREHLNDIDYMILRTERDKYTRGSFVVPLSEAKKVIEDPDSDFLDWVYMRDLGIVIFDVTRDSSHELFMGHWYRILHDILPTNIEFDWETVRGDDYEADAEAFLHAGYGFFLTSAYGVCRPQKSTLMKLTAAEKAVFRSYNFRELEPEHER